MRKYRVQLHKKSFVDIQARNADEAEEKLADLIENGDWLTESMEILENESDWEIDGVL